MAAYRRVDDLTVTCGLTACTPGSAPGPTLGIEYGKPLPLPFLHDSERQVFVGGQCEGRIQARKLTLGSMGSAGVNRVWLSD